MGRTKLEINKVEFQKVVTDLEAKQTFDNPSALWKAVEVSDWAKGLKPRPLTAAVAYVRAKELGIVIKTQPGKLMGGGVPRVHVPRSKKMKAFAESFAKMRKGFPFRFHPIIDKAEKGSAKACVKLKCLECSAFQPSEVRQCVITDCPLYPLRPFQGKVEVEETTITIDCL
jgi:ribosomal protein L44E